MNERFPRTKVLCCLSSANFSIEIHLVVKLCHVGSVHRLLLKLMPPNSDVSHPSDTTVISVPVHQYAKNKSTPYEINMPNGNRSEITRIRAGYKVGRGHLPKNRAASPRCYGRVWIFLVLGCLLVVLGVVVGGVYFNLRAITPSGQTDTLPTYVNSIAVCII